MSSPSAVYGEVDQRAIEQLIPLRCADAGDAVPRVASLYADAHVGYSSPIGGPSLRDSISLVGGRYTRVRATRPRAQRPRRGPSAGTSPA